MLTYARSDSSTNLSLTIENLSQAIYIVNRHAKTAPNPKFLYQMKKEALQKMITEGKAKKIGLHFSDNPRNSQQQSDVLVECGKYLFHIPPVKSDFSELPHLGKLDERVRNPKATFSLNQAKGYLLAYTGFSEPKETATVAANRRSFQKPVFKKLGEKY
ncbi:MAG: YkyB family protein [Bacillota bacterium]|nr:YkyB family protein [Bacillota bacterium]